MKNQIEQHEPKTVSRRRFIQWSSSLTIAIGAISSIEVISWWDTNPDEPYHTLNTQEAMVVRAVSGAAFPTGDSIQLDGGDANLDRFFDELLRAMTRENRVLLKLLLETVDHSTLPTEANHFSKLDASTQQQYLHTWLNHNNPLLRGAVQSLIVLLGMGYTSHPTASKPLSKYFRCGFGQ